MNVLHATCSVLPVGVVNISPSVLPVGVVNISPSVLPVGVQYFKCLLTWSWSRFYKQLGLDLVYKQSCSSVEEVINKCIVGRVATAETTEHFARRNASTKRQKRFPKPGYKNICKILKNLNTNKSNSDTYIIKMLTFDVLHNSIDYWLNVGNC